MPSGIYHLPTGDDPTSVAPHLDSKTPPRCIKTIILNCQQLLGDIERARKDFIPNYDNESSQLNQMVWFITIGCYFRVYLRIEYKKILYENIYVLHRKEIAIKAIKHFLNKQSTTFCVNIKDSVLL